MTRIILAAAAVVVLTSCFHEEVWSGPANLPVKLSM